MVEKGNVDNCTEQACATKEQDESELGDEKFDLSKSLRALWDYGISDYIIYALLGVFAIIFKDELLFLVRKFLLLIK